jgi:hypothetical protein
MKAQEKKFEEKNRELEKTNRELEKLKKVNKDVDSFTQTDSLAEFQ